MAKNKVIVTAGEALKKEGKLAVGQVALPGTFVSYGVNGYSPANANVKEIAIVDYSSVNGMDIDDTVYIEEDQLPVLYPEAGAEVNVLIDGTNAETFNDGELVAISNNGMAKPFVDIEGGTVIGRAKETISNDAGATGKVKVEVFAGPIVVAAVTHNITGFSAINVDAGWPDTPAYADKNEVIADLPDEVIALYDGGTVAIPVASWADTDNYDNTTPGDYTFTATLGNLPDGYTNTDTLVAVATVTITASTNITAFDAIADIPGGTTTDPVFPDADAIKEILPNSVTANGGEVEVPVTAWVDSDNYDKTTAAAYTFSAVLGSLPAGYTNTNNKTATVDVVVS